MGDRRSREKRREMWRVKEKRDGAERESGAESKTREKIKRKSREEIREKKG